MSNLHIVHVPIEWSILPIKSLRAIIKLEVVAHFQNKKKIEGTMICLEDTVGMLERHQSRIWMKRIDDTRSSPFYNDYVPVFISCVTPDPTKAHLQVFMVPRKWLECDQLECILYNEVKQYKLRYGTLEGLKIRLEEVEARVEHHADYFWARKTNDCQRSPELKTYLAIFVPCVDCSAL